MLQETGLSCYKIAQFTGLDEAYLSRLRSGGKQNPSVEVVMKISLALTHCSGKITIDDVNLLFRATGRSILTD